MVWGTLQARQPRLALWRCRRMGSREMGSRSCVITPAQIRRDHRRCPNASADHPRLYQWSLRDVRRRKFACYGLVYEAGPTRVVFACGAIKAQQAEELDELRPAGRGDLVMMLPQADIVRKFARCTSSAQASRSRERSRTCRRTSQERRYRRSSVQADGILAMAAIRHRLSRPMVRHGIAVIDRAYDLLLLRDDSDPRRNGGGRS